MADGNYPNTGVLWKSKYYISGGNKPYMTGSLEIDEDVINYINSQYPGPVKLELAAWTKTGKGGMFLSLKVQPPKDDRQQERPAQQERRPDLDDEVPF
jgi:hypothetical protein